MEEVVEGTRRAGAPSSSSGAICPRCGEPGIVSPRRKDARGRALYECPFCEAVWGPVLRTTAPRRASLWPALVVLLVAGLVLVAALNPGLVQRILGGGGPAEDLGPFAKDWEELGRQTSTARTTLAETQLKIQDHRAGRIDDAALAAVYESGASKFQSISASVKDRSFPGELAAVVANATGMADGYAAAFGQFSQFYAGGAAELRSQAESSHAQANTRWYALVDECRANKACAREADLETDVVWLRLQLDNRNSQAVRTFSRGWGEFADESTWCGSTSFDAWVIDVPAASRVEASCTATAVANSTLDFRTSVEYAGNAATSALVEVRLDLSGRLGATVEVRICPDGTVGLRSIGHPSVQVEDLYESRAPTC